MEHDLNQKSVDIILPNYNSELYISETINSVLDQNFKNWNLIIVDDNSNNKNKEIELKYDLERNVKLIKFSEGKIDIEFNENLGKNFVRNLSERLLGWTGRRWVISLTKEKGQKTFLEQKNIKKKELLEKEKNSEVHQKFKDIFSDLELIEVKKEKED